MKTIEICKEISSGFSIEDAQTISPLILKALETNDKITLDFTNVKFFTCTFFAIGITFLVGLLGETEFTRRVNIINLTENGIETYLYCFDQAKEYYKKIKSFEEERN